jgi:[methyl-Co(III) methanol-specific corrinoid protein]:coenzyme M methyltransferase
MAFAYGGFYLPLPYLDMNSRDEILALLNGQCIGHVPSFSGLIHVTSAGLESEGLVFHEVHKDAGKMARAAASTYKLTGFPSAVVPLDLYVEAEALGAEIDYRPNEQYEFPIIKKAIFQSTKEIQVESVELLKRGRISLVCDAIQRLKEDVGLQAVIGAWLPGPFTLMTLLVEPAGLFVEMKRQPEIVHNSLKYLSALLSQVGHAYHAAGADFLTVHDMGGSPAFIGPARFEQFVLPAIKDLIADLPKPRVLSICGNTNASMSLIAQAGADAISVDQMNDLAASRAVLGDETLLFGNIDPVVILSLESASDVQEAVARARQAGADAVWPGCDLVLQTPIENIRALVE